MGKSISGAEIRKMVGQKVIDLNSKEGLSFIIKFKNKEFETMFQEEQEFYQDQLSIIDEEDGYYVISIIEYEAIQAWYILHQKYEALSCWANAPVEFLGTFGNNVVSSGAIGIMPMAFLQA